MCNYRYRTWTSGENINVLRKANLRTLAETDKAKRSGRKMNDNVEYTTKVVEEVGHCCWSLNKI
jgi:hypothetical protein